MKAETRVLMCIATLAGGGAERQVRLLAPRLARRGIAVSLFSRLGKQDSEELGDAGIACFPLAAGNHHPATAIAMLGALNAARPQIVQSWLPQMDIVGGTLARGTGRRWILTERAAKAHYTRRGKDRLRSWLGQSADMIVANGRAGLDAWPRHPRRMIIPNGIDFEALARWPGLAGDERARHADRTLVVAVARLAPQKRIDRLLHAVARLRRRIPNLLLALVGKGAEEAALRALVRKLRIEDHVLFAGFRDDPWSWIAAGGVFVSASGYEGQPNAVLEAAAIGTPQVLSNLDIHRECVGARGALFVDPDDADALGGAIASLIERPALARATAAAARQAAQVFSIDSAADLYADLYRRMTSGSGFANGAGAIAS